MFNMGRIEDTIFSTHPGGGGGIQGPDPARIIPCPPSATPVHTHPFSANQSPAIASLAPSATHGEGAYHLLSRGDPIGPHNAIHSGGEHDLRRQEADGSDSRPAAIERGDMLPLRRRVRGGGGGANHHRDSADPPRDDTVSGDSGRHVCHTPFH